MHLDVRSSAMRVGRVKQREEEVTIIPRDGFRPLYL